MKRLGNKQEIILRVKTMKNVLVLLSVIAFCLSSAVYADMIAHYTFDEGSGTTAYDTSGYGFAANAVFKHENNVLTPGDTTLPNLNWTQGKIGTGALAFNGQSFLDCGTDGKFDLTTAYSVAAWIKCTDVEMDRWGYIANNATLGWRLSVHVDGFNDGDPTYVYTSPKADPVSIRSNVFAPNIFDGQWHFVAGTYDKATGVKMYIDNIAYENSAGGIDIPLSTFNTYIGANPEMVFNNLTEDLYYFGIMDDVRIYNHKISDAEYQNLFLAGLLDPTPVSPELVLWLKADTGVVDPNTGQPVVTGGEAYLWQDQSGNGLDAELAYGNPTLESSAFPEGNYNVIRFDGDDGLVVNSNNVNFGKLSANAYSIHIVGRVDKYSLSQTFYANASQTSKGLRLGIVDSSGTGDFNRPFFYTDYFGSQTADPLVGGRYYLLSATVSNVGGEKKLYINGDLVSEASGLSTYEPNSVVSIGALDIGQQFLTGDIAEIKVYRGVDATINAAVTAELMNKYQIDTSEPEDPYANPDTVILTAMTLSKTDGLGRIESSEMFNTFYPDGYTDIALYEGAIITDANVLANVVFNASTAMMIEVPLSAGQEWTFTWHNPRGASDTVFYGANLFFDGKHNQNIPGISVFAEMDADGSTNGNPTFAANAANATMGWPASTNTPGAGTLVYLDSAKKLKVELTNFVVYNQSVYNLDMMPYLPAHPLSGPDGATDIVGQFTLKVSQVQNCQEQGVYFSADVNKDCSVDFQDIVKIAADWLKCNDPQDEECNDLP